jgi:hypothetical protein
MTIRLRIRLRIVRRRRRIMPLRLIMENLLFG